MNNAHGGPLAVALADLQHIFSGRLHAFMAYGQPGQMPAPSLVLVRTLTSEDLAACAARASAWHRFGCATPLILTMDEFTSSLDAFPIEYGEILDTHQLVFGERVFEGLAIRPEDLRRACEVQVKSHLLHLRENFIECGGRPADIAALVADAAPAFAVLLRRLARLDDVQCVTNADLGTYAAQRPGLDPRVVGDVLALAANPDATGIDAVKLFPAYLENVEKLWHFVDRWRATTGR